MAPAAQPAYRIRRATIADAAEIMAHRRGMFHDMGYTDPIALDAMVATSLPQVERALSDDSYRGWLAETAEGKVIAGGGLHISYLLAHPNAPRDVRRAYVYNVYVAAECRRQGI